MHQHLLSPQLPSSIVLPNRQDPHRQRPTDNHTNKGASPHKPPPLTKAPPSSWAHMW